MAAPGKGHGRLHLGKHAAGREMAFGAILLGLRYGHMLQRFLLGLAPVDGDAVNRSQNDEHIRIDELRQLCGGKILVDDSGGADELSVLLDHGNAAAAHRDDHVSCGDQGLDDLLLHHVHGLGRGHYLAIATARVLHHGIALLRGNPVGLLLGVEGADGLGGLLESGILFVNNNLRHDSGDRLFNAALFHLVADAVLEMVADVALAHGAALREGHRRLDGARLRRRGHTKVNHAHLRAVAMGDDNVVALLNEVYDRGRSSGDELELFFRGVAERVAAQRDHNFCHKSLPLVF